MSIYDDDNHIIVIINSNYYCSLTGGFHSCSRMGCTVECTVEVIVV